MAGDRPKPPELSGRAAALAISLVAIALIGGAAWGWSYAGPMGGLLGVLLGAALGALIFTIARLTSQPDHFGERPAPDVRELPPDQAVQVLSAMLGAQASKAEAGGPGFELGGGLLGSIAKAEARAEDGDPAGAIAKLKALAEDHPRSPAIPAALARIQRRLADRDQDQATRDEARRSAERAITLAIHGGMNRLAATVFAELGEDERGALELEGGSWDRLAKILDHAGDEAGAELARSRASD